MKKLAALSLSGLIFVSGLMTSVVEASVSADAMMDKVIDKIVEEKENGNSLYYDLVVGYKDYINKDTLKALYGMLSEGDKARVRKQVGENTTDADIMKELEDLNSSDIKKIKSKIEEIAPGSGGSNSGGGSAGGSSGSGESNTPSEEEVIEVKNPFEAIENNKDDQISFKDIDSLWKEAIEAIEFMANKGILLGKAEGLFSPQDPITRAEFAKTIVALLDLKNNASVEDRLFTDVTIADWYYDYVQIAFKYGIIQGRDEATFAPNALITRQEMAVMISRAIKTMEKSEILSPLQSKEIISGYNDNNQVADWAEQDLALVVKNKLIQGKGENLLAPQENATRVEAVVILKRLLDFLNK